VAFDTGPGNMVIDALAREMGFALRPRREDRRFGPGGPGGLLDDLLADPYYPPPAAKSAGREQYGAAFVARLKSSGLPMPDLIATATVANAATVAMGVGMHRLPADLIVSGGGRAQSSDHGPSRGLPARNRDLHFHQPWHRRRCQGGHAFAMLAHQTWRKRPSNLPSATGAKHAGLILGGITFNGSSAALPRPPTRAGTARRSACRPSYMRTPYALQTHDISSRSGVLSPGRQRKRGRCESNQQRVQNPLNHAHRPPWRWILRAGSGDSAVNSLETIDSAISRRAAARSQ